MPHRSTFRLAALALMVATVSACALGERPSLAEPAPVSDSAAADVIEVLQRTLDETFIASYAITPSSGVDSVDATVTRTDEGVLTVEIGEVVFTQSPDGRTTTCDIGGGDCDDFANDARISDLGLTHLFWGPAFERRLQTDSGRRIGTSAASVASIAGQPATCVSVKVPSSLEVVGTVGYCAIDTGLLARYVGADVTVELLSFSAPSA